MREAGVEIGKKFYFFRYVILLSVCWSLTSHGRPPVVDLKILVDVSGSMVQSDPENLRAEAVRLLVEIMPQGSYAGISNFAGPVSEIVETSEVQAQWRQRAILSSRKIHAKGQRTNIEAALTSSLVAWENDQTLVTEKHVVLLTDGKVDVGKSAEMNERSKSRILKDVIPRFNNLNAKIHTIALSENADGILMKQLAVLTGGIYKQIDHADQLQRVFLHIVENAAEPDSLPLEENEFYVDRAVKELTLLVFLRKGAEPVELERPDGIRITRKKKLLSVKWNQESGYVLVTVTNPLSGKWKLLAKTDKDNRALITTDLKLKVSDVPAYISPGDNLIVESRLQENEKTIDHVGFLDLVSIRVKQIERRKEVLDVESIDTGESPDKKANDGVFTVQLGRTLLEGSHQLNFIADGGTFSRMVRKTVQVIHPVNVRINQSVSGESLSYHITVSAKSEFLVPETLNVAVRVDSSETSMTKIMMSKTRSGTWRGIISDVKNPVNNKVWIAYTAEDVSGQKIKQKIGPMGLDGDRFDPAVMLTVDESPRQKIKTMQTKENAGNSLENTNSSEESEPLIRSTAADWRQTAIWIVILNVVFLMTFFVIRKWRRRRLAENFQLLEGAES